MGSLTDFCNVEIETEVVIDYLNAITLFPPLSESDFDLIRKLC